jgi:solute carrier family 25 protein 44
VLRELLLEEGPRGLLRGVVPRMASSCLWGTCMVSAYEFLKRICALPEPEEQQLLQQ